MSPSCLACRYSTRGVCARHASGTSAPGAVYGFGKVTPGSKDAALAADSALLEEIDEHPGRVYGAEIVESCMKRVESGEPLSVPQRVALRKILDRLNGGSHA